jgi:integrase
MAKNNSINLKTKTVRKHLEGYREPYWMKLPTEVMKGGSLGFKRSPDSGVETWHARVYLDGAYRKTNLGEVIPKFEYRDAYSAALKWARDKKGADPAPEKEYTLEDVTDAYLRHLQGNSSPRLMDKRQQADKRLNALIPQRLFIKKAKLISAQDITSIQQNYQQRKNLQGQPISPDSVNRIMAHLIAALNYGFRQSMIANNNGWRHYRRLEEAKVKRNAKQYIELEDRQTFIEACPAALKAFAQAMNIMAARPSELRRLRVSGVDFDNPDAGQRGVSLVTYKGKGSVRLFPLPEGSTIQKLFKELTHGKQPDDFVFTTEKGKQWSQANLAKLHNKVRDDNKFSDAFESYVWRHCRVSDWANAKFPAPEVAKLAGTSLEYIQHNYFKSRTEIQSSMAVL